MKNSLDNWVVKKKIKNTEEINDFHIKENPLLVLKAVDKYKTVNKKNIEYENADRRTLSTKKSSSPKPKKRSRIKLILDDDESDTSPMTTTTKSLANNMELDETISSCLDTSKSHLVMKSENVDLDTTSSLGPDVDSKDIYVPLSSDNIMPTCPSPLIPHPKKRILNEKEQPVPISHLPLESIRIVVTGVFESVSRENIENHIKRLGGICTSAVSGKTRYLVYGTALEDGRPIQDGSKYKKAMQIKESKTKNNIEILNEKNFFQLYPLEIQIVNPIQSFEEVDTVMKPYQDVLRSECSTLWCEKWRPKKISDIIGNNEVVRKLHYWLTNWDSIVGIKASTSHAIDNTTRTTDNFHSRACMLSGPPGIGKTSSALVVVSECNYDYIEFNSSDDRGKDIIEVIQDMASGGQTLKKYLINKNVSERKQFNKKVVIIMDEMDGLSSGDRGGAQALLKLINVTLCPIICICNDRTNPKIRTLASKCYDLRFHKPSKNIIAKKMCELALSEGLHVEYNASELLCEQVGNDIRQIINIFQMIPKSSNVMKVGFDMIQNFMKTSHKDSQVMLTFFEVIRKLFTRNESSRMNITRKLDCFFVDYDIMPIFVQENYLACHLPYFTTTQLNTSDKLQYIDKFSYVADCFSFADILINKLRKDGKWSLLTDVGILTTCIPSFHLSGSIGRIDFPRWLGKNSIHSKNKRLLYELNLCLSSKTSCTPESFCVSGYLDCLYQHLLGPLFGADPKTYKNACQETIELSKQYNITREHLTDHFEALRLKRQGTLYDKIPTALKRTLTSLFNTNNNTATSYSDNIKMKIQEDLFTQQYLVGDQGESDLDSDRLQKKKKR